MSLSILVMMLGSFGCHDVVAPPHVAQAAAGSGQTPAGQPRPRVPMTPPDSVPADLHDPTKWVSGEPHFAGRILRDVVMLLFRPGTSQPDRQAAVDLVHGVVVGGAPYSTGDGVYLIRIPSNGTIEPLFVAIAALRKLPQVAGAFPDWIISLETSARSELRTTVLKRSGARSARASEDRSARSAKSAIVVD